MMIQYFENLLRRWGVLPPFDRNDVLNADIEDKSRDTEKVIGRIRSSLGKRHEANARLRHSLLIARRRTNSFEQFEALISGRTIRDDDN